MKNFLLCGLSALVSLVVVTLSVTAFLYFAGAWVTGETHFEPKTWELFRFLGLTVGVGVALVVFIVPMWIKYDD